MLRYNLPDRRKNYRVYVQIPIVCELVNSADNTTRAKTVIASDLNSEGMFFQIGAEEVLPLNIQINVSFRLPKSANLISAVIKVARIEAAESKDIFGVGAVFMKLQDKDREEIRQLIEQMDINKLLEMAIEEGASDLHLVTNQPPILRVQGELEGLNMSPLEMDDIPEMLYSIMNKQQIKRFEQDKELDFGIQYDINNRFRVNVHQQRGFLEATFRLINTKISSFEDLNLPEVVKDLARHKDGLVIVSGPTGSGKTTTIAAMVELINRERKAVIITLERPIEYVHANIKSVIKQREVGVDTLTFSGALRSALKQDPNVIVVGELDDLDTVRTAIVAAEAGYLVIASYHAPNTLQTLDRLASSFQPENRRQVLTQLSNCLIGVICQLLIPCKAAQKRVLATEIVTTNDAVKRIIRNDELMHLPTIIQTGSAFKMQVMGDSIKRYLQQGLIDEETATFYSEEFIRQNR